MDLSVIILTYNEEIHIRRCLEKICEIARDIFIVDSYSTDRTLEIAQQYDGVHILKHKWVLILKHMRRMKRKKRDKISKIEGG